MKRPCSYSDCGSRRVHHERPDIPRGTQMIEVPDDHPADKPFYCSIECACYDGAFSVTKGWLEGATTKSGFKL
jgi:hypothetical protein